MTGGIKFLAMNVLQRHGGVPSQSQPAKPGDTKVRLSETARCSVPGGAHETRRQSHPLDSSAYWEAWLRRWQPPEGTRIQ